MVEIMEQNAGTLLQLSKNALLGEITGSVLHELHQPLTSIVLDAGYLKMLAEQPSETAPEELRKVGNDIENDVWRFQRITEHLRAFAYPREETVKADVGATIESCFKLVGEQFRARGITIEIEIAKKLPSVNIDVIELEYVFLNLITNARKAIEAKLGERTLKVEKHLCIEAEQRGEWVAVRLSDSGLDYASKHLKELLTPFFTISASGKTFAYNVFVAEQIISSCGGALLLSSQSPKGGVGNTVELLLPI
jgi:C4-dicarboxylate-specific signal transduction histidine kinase